MKKNLLQSKDWHARFIAQESWTRSLREYIFSNLDFNDRPTVLEIGSGTGVILSKIPLPTSKMHGIDLNFSHLSFCQREFPEIGLTQGNGKLLPFANNVFNVAFCHYLLLWIKDPVQVVREMIRVVKPGGYVMILAEPDYGSRIDYPTKLEALGAAQTDALKLQGAEPNIGRKLKEIARQAGLQDYNSGILGNESNQSFSLPYWESEWKMYEHDLAELIPLSDLKRYKRADYEAHSQGTRTHFIPTFYLWAKIP